jgi:hypothetical protein
MKEAIESLKIPETEELPPLEEPQEVAEFKKSEVIPEDLEMKEAIESLKIPETEEFTGLQETEELPEPEKTPQIRESKSPFESLETREPEELHEPKEPEGFPESEELPKSKEVREAEDFAEFHEFEEPSEIKVLQKPKEPEGVKESGKLFKTLRMPESEELEGFPESEEFEEYQKPEKLRELIEPPAGPLEDEQLASVLSSEPLLRKRIKRTKSTLVCFLLTAWSLLCLFLLFYVPGRYADLLRNSAFGNRFQLGEAAVDCLIVSLMVLWFLGALMLFVITTGLQKDRHPMRRYSY